MTTDTQPPDRPPCDCGGCRELRTILQVARAEPPLHERQAKRETDRRAQRAMEDAAAEQVAAVHPLRTA